MQILCNEKTISDDFRKISAAIHCVLEHQRGQSNSREIAHSIGLNFHYFQSMFPRWVGVSSEDFLKHITDNNTRKQLNTSTNTMDLASSCGLSSPAHLYHLPATIEATDHLELKFRGSGLEFFYGFHPTFFGEAIIVINNQRLCGIGFTSEIGRNAALAEQRAGWENGKWRHDNAATQRATNNLLNQTNCQTLSLSLLLRGTPFQITVWKSLLRIPIGAVISYANLAARLGKPAGARAVGTACRANRLGVLIPCHRVIRGSGIIDGYRWGTARKRAMLAYESVKATVT